MKQRYGYAGVHLFDRASGLNILVDEKPVPRTKWSVAPRYMSFALTNACELACSYCYASKAPAKLRPELIERWARELDEAGCFGIGFGGGEPTLFPGFAQLCREVHSATDLAITMTTHGHRFDAALVDRLSGNIEFIRLSMDGIGSTYEGLRGRPFSVFKEKLGLVRATARFGINYVVNADTIDDLQRAAEFAIDNGAEELLLLPETLPSGTLSLGPKLMERLSSWVRQNYKSCRLATSAHGGLYIEAPMLMVSDPAYETFDFMHVDALGVLKPSAFATRGIPLRHDTTIIQSIERVRELHTQRPEETVQ
ncbi:MAG: radical SAM protein [Bradyrhizobium sp.]|uniref:radical SAM protein n=1 Tax=Bradyrhizobium sp. TaxID=376 RepID=UPI0029B96168|nr:radical SAM protein [Bradyrhizobium sp.]MDX3967703.1 radical SAM protein [Bradyrhizobium sp.]